MGLDAMILVFIIFNFKLALSLSSFTLKRLFSSSSLSAIRVVSSAYLRLLMFLLPVLIPACNSSSLDGLYLSVYLYGLPWWLSGKEPALPMQEMWVQSLGWEDPLE